MATKITINLRLSTRHLLPQRTQTVELPEIYMAGCYQTKGATVKRGTGLPNTGGEWVNVRSDNTIVMREGYAYLGHFFKRFEWLKTNPHD